MAYLRICINMARGISLIVTTAVVAGAIGFGAGVYLVPNEKANQFRTMANERADQFRAMVQGELGAIYRVVYSDKANPDFLRNLHKRSPLERHLGQRHNQMSRRDRSLAPPRNAILATLRVVVDSLSMPQLHKLSLTVMLPPRAVRRPNKTISHHMH